MSHTTPEYDGGEARPFFAIVSSDGSSFDQSLSAARYLRIFRPGADGCRPVELREAPPPVKGIIRWRRLAETLHDCAALLANAIGEAPILILANHQIRTYMLQGEVEDALRIIADGGDLTPMKVPTPPRLGNASLGGCCGGGRHRRNGGCVQGCGPAAPEPNSAPDK